jgi:two-component system, cell cycle response regulator
MAKGTVLIIDDDPIIVDLLEAALRAKGYDVLTAMASPALALARDRHPDVILLDLTMPVMSGEEISRRLRADPKTADIPLIVMSALDRIMGASADLAVDDRLPKPFQLDQLYAMIARWVRSG